MTAPKITITPAGLAAALVEAVVASYHTDYPLPRVVAFLPGTVLFSRCRACGDHRLSETTACSLNGVVAALRGAGSPLPTHCLSACDGKLSLYWVGPSADAYARARLCPGASAWEVALHPQSLRLAGARLWADVYRPPDRADEWWYYTMPIRRPGN